MRRMGIPKSEVDCIFMMLQEAAHRVPTGYGDSTSHCGGTVEETPMYEICQGNGAGPAIGAVLSSLYIQRKKGFGFYFFTPQSEKEVQVVGYAFVDDSDLGGERLKNGGNWQELLQKLQASVNIWEGSLSATSGAIVPQKSYWYLVDFQWSGGNWRYKKINKCQGNIRVRNIHGAMETLKMNEVGTAEETLGIHMAPDGNK